MRQVVEDRQRQRARVGPEQGARQGILQSADFVVGLHFEAAYQRQVAGEKRRAAEPSAGLRDRARDSTAPKRMGQPD